jgi:hypothetical protein
VSFGNEKGILGWQAYGQQSQAFSQLTGRGDRSIPQCKFQDEKVNLCLEITDFYPLRFEILALENLAKVANSVRFTA